MARNSIIVLFLISGLVIGSYLFFYKDNSQNEKQTVLKPWETESVLLQLESNKKYDIVIMGSSHGRILSRNKNHEITERILEKKVANISAGSSCIIPELTYLKTLYSKGNTTPLILYVIDPWCFYTEKYNETREFNDEPFDEVLYVHLNASQSSKDVKEKYKNNQSYSELIAKPVPSISQKTEVLEKIDNTEIEKRLLDLYSGDINKQVNLVYIKAMKQILETAKNNNSNVIFILPATLYKDPNHQTVKELLAQFEEKYNTRIIDMSDSIQNPRYFYDHDHLNSSGIEKFMEQLNVKIENY